MTACGHYPSRKGLHSADFRGIVEALTECIYTVSGVSTSFTIDPSGYAWNFEGIVQAIEDLNWTLSGVGGGGGGGSNVAAGSGIYITQSGTFQVINATISSVSGVTYTAGSGIYLSDGGTRFNLFAQGGGSTSITYSGNLATISSTGGGGGGGASVTVSGSPGTGFGAGSLWFDTNQGRLFIYASGNGIQNPAWYQTNAEALAYMSDLPPSGAGQEAPPRDGSLWFNTLLGSLFVYDTTTSGWYEAGPSRGVSYGTAAPPPQVEGALWVDSTTTQIRVWDGSSWADITVDGGVF